MKFPLLQFSALVFPFLAKFGNAIIFDASCDTYTGRDQLLQTAFTSAFELAADGAEQLNESWISGETKDSYITNLAYWLFGPEADWEDAYMRLNGLSGIPQTFTTDKTDDRNALNVIVYCNLKRYMNTDIENRKWESYAGGFILFSSDSFENCQTGIDDESPLALTVNWNYSPGILPPLGTVQLCPWYLTYITTKQWVFVPELNQPGVEGQLADLREERSNLHTDMDLLALFDAIVLHELTHTRASGISQPKLGEPENYFWADCIDSPSPSNSPLFCIGVRMIKLGYSIYQDGSIWTASQVQELDFPIPEGVIAGHPDGAAELIDPVV